MKIHQKIYFKVSTISIYDSHHILYIKILCHTKILGALNFLSDCLNMHQEKSITQVTRIKISFKLQKISSSQS
jgi:hypothetical protein